ncbi:MAG: M14 family metallocarboxypeptidase [Candidatus Latescibacterota bacterium]
MRSYDDVVRRLGGLRDQGIGVRELGRVEGYPVFCVERRRRGRPTTLLMAGTHGDEPAGVEAALAFLEDDPPDWLEALDALVIPCLNPYGYVHDTRHNAQDVDVNWAYARTDVPEVQLLRGFAAGRRFEFVLDFHEDWESPGYYLYELRRGAPVIGLEVTRRVSRVCPVNTSAVIDDWPARGGLIAPDIDQEVRRRESGIPLAMFLDHTDHLLTSESPTMLEMGARVAAHLVTLETVAAAHGPARP